jgi:hypothetical protein
LQLIYIRKIFALEGKSFAKSNLLETPDAFLSPKRRKNLQTPWNI